MPGNKSQDRSVKGPIIVAEIGNEWLKLIQMESGRAGPSITRLHLERFEQASMALSSAITRAMTAKKFAKAPVFACLPRQMVNIRMLRLPSTDPDEIRDMVDLQAVKQTPYSSEEIFSDFRIMEAGGEGYSKVMLVIVQRGVLRHRYAILEEAGLQVQRMSVSSEGTLNWYARVADSAIPGKADVLVDVDSYYTDFLMVSDGSLVFTRSILTGANQLLEKSESAKQRFAREIQRSLEISKSESAGLSVGRILLTGAGPNVEGLREYLAEQLGLPTELKKSCSVVAGSPEEPSLEGPEYRSASVTSVVGIGLATGSLQFDLVPDAVRMRKALVARAQSLTTLGILVMTILVALSSYATAKLFLKRGRVEALKQQIEATEPAVRDVERMHEIIRVVDRRQNPNLAALHILSEIQKHVPEDVFFDEMTISAEKARVDLGGTCGSRTGISTLVKRLEQSDLFQDVRLSGATTQERNTRRYRFEITAAVESGT